MNVAAGRAIVVMMIAWAVPVLAQNEADRQVLGSTSSAAALRNQIEQRFDVLAIQGGVVLTPKRGNRDVRAIQVTSGDIALDGDLVTGSELRRRLGGDDADLVIRLSYLDASQQRALFEPRQSLRRAEPNLPAPPAPPALPPPAPPLPPQPSRADEVARRVRERMRTRLGRGSDRVRIGGGVQVDEGEVVNGDVVAIGGGARVDGEVRGDVVAIGGGVDLGPHADVQSDVTVVGGSLRRDPAARVGGDINQVEFGDINFWPRGWRLPRFGGPAGLFVGSAFGSVFALVSTVTRLAVLCILASIVLLFGREHVERVGVRAASEPMKAGAVGLLIQLLFVPVLAVTIVLLVVTIIGIPLLLLVPFALLAFALLFLVGFTAVVSDVGRLAVGRFGWQGQNPYLVAALGIAIVLSPVLIGRLLGFGGGLLWPITWTLLLLGFLAEYAVWTVGLGAIALVRFDRK